MVVGVNGVPVDDEVWVSDEELTAEALAATEPVDLDEDAVPFGAAEPGFALLPAWYMPASGGASRHVRVTAFIVLLIVGSLLLAEAFGLCLTSGKIELPL